MKNNRIAYKECYEKKSGEICEVVGIIKRFKEYKEDGYENLVNDIDFIIPEDEITSPIYFYKRRTLLVNAQIYNQKIGDGHIWIVEDMEKLKGLKEGDTVRIRGIIRKYKKYKNKITEREDYCIEPLNYYKMDEK